MEISVHSGDIDKQDKEEELLKKIMNAAATVRGNLTRRELEPVQE